MKMTVQLRRRMRQNNILFVVLLLITIGMLAWLSTRYEYQADWTSNGRNTLSAESAAVLDKFPGSIAITSYAHESEILRAHIKYLLHRYQRHKPDMTLTFVNPDLEPQQIRDLGITVDGEMVVEFQGHSEMLKDLTERGLSNALQRLLRVGERRIVFVQGHGERDPQGAASFDQAQWSAQLTVKGFDIATINLARDGEIPKNTAVLVLSSPRSDYLPTEVTLVTDFVAAGGHLLWLADPGPLYGLEPLAQQLSLRFRSGIIIDPNISQVGMLLFGTSDPRITLVSSYSNHPIVNAFAFNTLFPMSQSLLFEPGSDWQASVFLSTMSNAWQEREQTQGQVTFDDSDISGPLNLGIALTQNNVLDVSQPGDMLQPPQSDEQRVVVIGDGDFLSNAALGLGGNMQLAMNVVNWLSDDDQLVDIPIKPTNDTALELSTTTVLIIGVGFLVVIPLGLLASGFAIWWRRRKY